MQTKSLSQLKIWLLENEDYFKEIQPIVKIRCEHCLDKKDTVCVWEKYKEEHEFSNYYGRVTVLVNYLKSSENLTKLLQEYESLDLLNQETLRVWVDKLWLFWSENYLCGDIDKMLVRDSNKEIIGFQIIYAKLFDENPFYVPIQGFENLIRFNELYLKYIKSQEITIPPELLINYNLN